MKQKNFFSHLSALGLLMALSACGGQPPTMQGSDYKTMIVTLSDRTLQRTYAASIQGKQDVSIYPQVSGLITQVCINEGATVKRGQLLFVIDQAPYRAALRKAEANVEQARAAVATARLTAESKRQLHEEQIVSDYDLQMALNTLHEQEAQLTAAQAQLLDAQTNLSYTEVKSPVNGTAGMTSFRIGALVGPTMNEPLISVSDNEEMYVYFSLSEQQVLQADTLLSGSKPEVELLLADGSRYAERGRVDAVSGVVDRKTGAISVRALFPNPSHRLLSGGVGNLLWPVSYCQVVVIPQEATYEIQDRVFVYKVVEGKAQSTMVSVIPTSDGREYIVTSGLQAGDEIIAEGAGLVREGTVVNSTTPLPNN